MGDLTISSAGDHTYHVIQVDGANNYQKSNEDVQCTQTVASVELPATLSASFTNPNPSSLTTPTSFGESFSENVAGNIKFPTFEVVGVEARDATVKIYATTSSTSSNACDAATEVYSGSSPVRVTKV